MLAQHSLVQSSVQVLENRREVKPVLPERGCVSSPGQRTSSAWSLTAREGPHIVTEKLLPSQGAFNATLQGNRVHGPPVSYTYLFIEKMGH